MGETKTPDSHPQRAKHRAYTKTLTKAEKPNWNNDEPNLEH